jgi:chemotaxis protein MotD
MNALEVLNATPGAGTAVRPADGPPDDPGGDASRAFSALLDAFTDPGAPATADGAVPTAAPALAVPKLVLRQALQVKSDSAPAAPTGDATVEIVAQVADKAAAGQKTSGGSDDTALTDLIAAPDATPTTTKPDPAPSLQLASPLWSATIGAAAGAMNPAPTEPAPAVDLAPQPRPSTTARGEPQRAAANAAATDGLSADVGRLFDAAAGATEAVLAKVPASASGPDIVLNTNVTVLRTETHLPPVTPTTPLHQIVSAITGPDGLGAQAEATAPGAPDASTPAAPERQLVRTLDIRLEPPDLGSVTVKLRLSGQHLALRISADTVTTAQSLDQDRDTLASLLRGNGYSTEISAVRHEPATAAVPSASATDSSASTQGSANQAGGQGSGSGSADGGPRHQGGQPGGHQQGQHGAPAGYQPGDHHDAVVQDVAAGNGLYL